jgi:hypothetical protein
VKYLFSLILVLFLVSPVFAYTEDDFIVAIDSGNLSLVQIILAENPSFLQGSLWQFGGVSPLGHAISYASGFDDVSIMSYLLDAGASTVEVATDGDSLHLNAIEWAGYNGGNPIVLDFLNNFLNPPPGDNGLWSPIMGQLNIDGLSPLQIVIFALLILGSLGLAGFRVVKGALGYVGGKS